MRRRVHRAARVQELTRGRGGRAGAAPAEPAEAEALVALYLAPEGVQAAPVERLTWVPPGRAAGFSSVLVAGGQHPEQPGLLTLLPLLPAELARPAALPPSACRRRWSERQSFWLEYCQG